MEERSGNNTFICEIHHTNMDANKKYTDFEMVNTDNNRFNCFACDYDVCDACVSFSSVSDEIKAPGEISM